MDLLQLRVSTTHGLFEMEPHYSSKEKIVIRLSVHASSLGNGGYHNIEMPAVFAKELIEFLSSHLLAAQLKEIFKAAKIEIKSSGGKA